jgi:hypothetical protein
MLSLLRWITAVYGVVLTALLLAPNPWALLGLRPPPGEGSSFGTHFGCFVVLGVLARWARFSGRPMAWAGALVGYAVLVELGQALVPTRSVQWQDLAANLTGLACGTLLGWAALQVRNKQHR